MLILQSSWSRSRTAPSANGRAQTDDARLLRLAENAASLGHWHWEKGSDVLTWSEQMYRIHGRDPASFTPTMQSVLEATHPDDRANVERVATEAIGAGHGFEMDCRIIRADGEVRSIISRGQPEFDDSGRLISLVGVVTDVTEAFAAIRSIQDQNEMLDLAAELAHVGHWVWNRETDRIAYCSEQLARIHDLAPATFLAKFARPDRIAAAVVDEDRPRYLDVVDHGIANAKPYKIEYRIKTGKGEVKHVREIGQPIFDYDDKMVRYIATVQDVTEATLRESELTSAKRVLEEQAENLRRSETKLRDVIENSIQGIIVMRDYAPVFCNQSYAHLMGAKEPDDFIKLGDVRGFMDPHAASCATGFWEEIMASKPGAKIRREGQAATFDGRMIWTDSVGSRIEWEGHPAVILTVIDITEQKLAEEQLRKKTQELQELNLQKDKLFSIIAHDLRSPFNSVIGFADLLAAKAHELSPGKVANYAHIVRESASGVHDLLDNLLAWATYQIRDGALKLAPMDLRAVATSGLEPLMHMAEAKGVTIVNSIDGVSALGDEPLVRIVIRNLVSNGIKFSKGGGMVRLTAGPAPDAPAMVRVTVRDDGVGLSAAAAADLFDLGRISSATGTRGEKGTGLGLYLCRDIISRHGGTIGADASAATGATFHFTLPAAH